MHVFASAGAGFLLAVLWFDLMFDVQAKGRADTVLPDDVLASIGAYYRRVTTDARPMNRLVAVTMLATLAALAGEAVENRNPIWLVGISLAGALAGIGLAAARTVRNAVALGSGQGTAVERSRLARAVFRDHLFCFAAIALVLVLQLIAR